MNPRNFSRRDWLRSSMAMIASLSAPVSFAGFGAQPTEQARREIWRAASRLAFGPTSELLAEIEAVGARAWALKQIELARQEAQRLPRVPPQWSGFLAPLPELFESARRERELKRLAGEKSDSRAAAPRREPDWEALAAPEFFSRRISLQTKLWWLSRCAQPASEPPLLARMTQFWFNHFNVFDGKGPVRPMLGHYLVHAIRAHALGKFSDLLLATARHPAMLFYLDQHLSRADNPAAPPHARGGLNENYAREVMELHTLGVHGGYTQQDVRELARVLTGWGVDPHSEDGFRFYPARHDGGAKSVLGQVFPSAPDRAGEQEGGEALLMLARHEATARRLADRLARFFVADEPPRALIDRLAMTFHRNEGDIAAMLRQLFSSSEFWVLKAKLIKTPLDYAASVLAALNAADDDAALMQAIGFLASSGQPLFGWPTPDGYSFDAESWMAPEMLTRRVDFVRGASRNRMPPEFLAPWLGARSRAVIEAAPPALRAALILASPEFMWK